MSRLWGANKFGGCERMTDIVWSIISMIALVLGFLMGIMDR